MKNSSRIRLGVAGILGVSTILAGCGTQSGQGTGSNNQVTITFQANAYSPNSPQEVVFNSLIKKYEQLHPNVHIKLILTNTNTTSQQAWLVTEASGGTVPDISYEQYNEVDSGVLPQGLLTNLTPYLNEPNPYVKGNKHWIDLWDSTALPYMKNAQGQIYLLVGSQVATGIFYNKALFKEAGITSTPTTFSEWLSDMKLLKQHGITPLMFATGSSDHCNSSWYERKFMSELLMSELPKINPDGSQVVTGKETAIAIHDGIISMNNPAYADGWKLLGELSQYMAPGGSTYDVCAQPTASSPPLNPENLLVDGKVAMEWGATWFIPQLNQLGFKGKYGFFTFPLITTSTTPYSSNKPVIGVVGGPNGSMEPVVPTQKADSAMTPEHLKWVINFMQYMWAPQNFGLWNNNSSQNSTIPLIKGAVGPSAAGLSALLPKGKPPVTIDGVLDAALTAQASNAGNNLLQGYLDGTVSWSKFSTQWEQILQQAANTWAAQNNYHFSN